jgi:NAD(P)-dependent dehydrogenase (short-subunit alcohol dehydrogenase family)
VRALAEEAIDEVARLDALVNNAGIAVTALHPAAVAGDSRADELRFAVNYLAGYLLTKLLLPTLERSAPTALGRAATRTSCPSHSVTSACRATVS